MHAVIHKDLGLRWYPVIAAILVALMALLVGSVVFAQDSVPGLPVVAQDPLELIKILQQAFSGGQWHLVVAAAILILVTLASRMWGVWASMESIRPWLKWIAMALAVLASIGTALLTGAGVGAVAMAALSALSAGLAAIGGWELIGKWLTTKLSPARSLEEKAKTVAKDAARTGSLNLGDIKGLGLKVYDPDSTNP
jgi:hypothetical protein